MSALSTTICRGATALGFVALAACASAEKGEPQVASEAQTGSNIPKKNRDRVQTINTDGGMQPLPPASQPPRGSGGG